MWLVFVLALVAVLASGLVECKILTPPYFNVAEKRGMRITASATCGVGRPSPELFCNVIEASPADFMSPSKTLASNNQLSCDYCDPKILRRSYSAEKALDGSASSQWQSPPLSRGYDYSNVNLTIDLGQMLTVNYFLIVMGDSPQPEVWTLERSTDHGKTYHPWQYFADTKANCLMHFGAASLKRLERDDSVICETDYATKMISEGDMYVVSLLNNRPSALDYLSSPSLREWTRATNIRIRFQRTEKFLEELTSASRNDPSVKRRFFYSVKDISIGGRCECNGHADSCNTTDSSHILVCKCQHNTCGQNCEKCCPGFFRSSGKQWIEPDVCQACECNFSHATGNCADVTGQCECKVQYAPPRCERCSIGNCDFPTCKPCHVDNEGADDPNDSNDEVEGEDEPCPDDASSHKLAPEQCAHGFFNYPQCQECDCDKNSTVPEICNKASGKCLCKIDFEGERSDQGNMTVPNTVNVTAIRTALFSTLASRFASDIKRLGSDLGQSIDLCSAKISELNTVLVAHKELIEEQDSLIEKQQAEIVKLKRVLYEREVLE